VLLAEIMQEVADRLDTLSGVRVHAHPPKTIVPPAAIVSYPEGVEFDQTYGRGMTSVDTLKVWVVVGNVTDRAARDKLSEYVSDQGPNSVKLCLEDYDATQWDDLTVASVEFDVVTIAGVDYMAAGFTINLACQGTPSP
jgi:hypothetical protein